MEDSSDLFRLIKSLSKSEKRYFKMYASTHRTNSNAVKLFDEINGIKIVDEKAVLSTFGGTPFYKQLSVTKVYLQKYIMRSLRSFHAGTSVEFTLREMMNDVEILYKKGLFPELKKLLLKARKIEFWK